MSRSIGDVTFDLMNGTVASLKSRSETWEVFGLDGVGVAVGGLGDAEFQLNTVFFASNSAEAFDHIGFCEAMQGTIVTIVDAFGDSFDRCFIEHVETDNSQKAVIWGSFTSAVRVSIQWRIKRV